MLMTVSVVVLTIVLHKLYIKVIRHGTPHRSSSVNALGAWFVCLIIALVISGSIFG